MGPDAPFARNGSYVVVQPDAKVTEVHQWNLAIQHQFGQDWLLSATYSGNQTEHLLTSYAINPAVVLPCPGGAAITACNSTANQNSRRLFTVMNYPGNELLGPVRVFDDSGTAYYNGLILSIQKRLSKGVSINANHTWSHCISDLGIAATVGGPGSGLVYANNRRFDRSNCQSISLGGTSLRRPPSHLQSQHGLRSAATWRVRVGPLSFGWKLAGIYRASSAPWMTAVLTSDVHPDRSSRQARSVRSKSCQIRCARESPSDLLGSIPQPFCTNPAPGTYSTLGRGNIPGPSFFQFDAAVSRIFRIQEGLTLEVRGEAFDLTNSFRAGVRLRVQRQAEPGVRLTSDSTTGE